MSTTTTLPPLLSLLPSYTATTIPPRLTSLASSLLTQSRQRAPNLKPDEEIARPYACAEIAVDRLREGLRLPPKKTGRAGGGGPPCKPAVYKKLLGFLRGVLLEREVLTTQRSGGAGKRKRDAVADEEEDVGQDGDEDDDDDEAAAATPSKRARTATAIGTPTKTRTTPVTNKTPLSANKQQTPTTATTKKTPFLGRLGASKSSSKTTTTTTTTSSEAPSHIMPTIRKLTKHYSLPAMAPHVYTGVCVILRLDGQWPPSEEEAVPSVLQKVEVSTTALAVAVYLMVLTKMQKGQLKTRMFEEVCETAVGMFGGKGKGKGKEGGEAVFEEGMISEWIRRINREGWCKGQAWFESVPKGTLSVGLDGMGRGVAGEGAADDDDDEENGILADDDDDDDDDEEDVDTSGGGGLWKKRFGVDLDKDDPEGVLLPGLGTMLQESLDWNSDEKKRAFQRWKRGIMQRLSDAPQAGGNGSSTTGKQAAAGRKTKRQSMVAAH